MEGGAASAWAARAGLAVAILAAILVGLAPLGRPGGVLPMPDLVYVLLAAAVLRRPEAAPAGMIVAASLGADLLGGAPLGIGTLALLGLAAAAARVRDTLVRGPFLLEWLAVAGGFAAMLAAQLVALRLTFAPSPGWTTLGPHAAVTVLSYPVAAFGIALFRRRPGETEGLR